MSYFLAALMVYAFVGLLSVVAAFLLALGPLFIVLLLFNATRRFFEQWVGQLANYALITVLVALVASMLLGVVRSYSASAVASGAAVSIAEAARLCVMAALIFLILRQVPSIAGGLSAGIALSTYGAVSRTLDWALSGAKSTAYQGARGLMDGLRGDPISRWDSLRRSGGNLLGSGVRRLWSGAAGSGRGGAVVPRERVMPPLNRR
jgi:type IV secretion system protein VirB6